MPCSSAWPEMSACAASWPTCRLAMRSCAPCLPAAKVASRLPSVTGSGWPSCSNWKSPSATRSTAISTGSSGSENGSPSSSAGAVSGDEARPMYTEPAETSRTCSRRSPRARQFTSRCRSVMSTRVPPASRSSLPTDTPRSSEPFTSSAWPFNCWAAVVRSSRVPFCDPTSQNRKPPASTASMARPGNHHTSTWRRNLRRPFKTRSPRKNAGAGRGRAGRRPSRGIAGRLGCAPARRRRSPPPSTYRQTIPRRRRRPRTRPCPSAH